MSYGRNNVFTAVVTSGAVSSTALSIETYPICYLAIQSMTSNSQLHLLASDTISGTYRRVLHPPINSSTVAVNTWTIPSSITNAIVPLPAGLMFIKIEQTATADSGQTFKIICGS